MSTRKRQPWTTPRGAAAREARKAGRLESAWNVVDGLLMHVRVSVDPVPDGAPANVLVHGLAVSSLYLIPTAVRLAPHYRVYVPDLPGYGKSAKPGRVLGVAELADVLAAWMDHIGLASAVLIGNSMGCQIIVNLALRHPDRIERAVLIGPTMDPAGATFFEQARRLLIDISREPVSSYFIQAYDYLRFGFRRLVCTFEDAIADRIEEKLPHVHVPTLVVRGARDPIVPQRWAEEAARLLPRGRLVVVPGSAHVVNYNAPRVMERLVRAFLNEALPTPRSARPPGTEGPPR